LLKGEAKNGRSGDFVPYVRSNKLFEGNALHGIVRNVEMRISVGIQLSDDRALRSYAALEHERCYRDRQEKISCDGSPIPHCIPPLVLEQSPDV
jgi:hypothetical protein